MGPAGFSNSGSMLQPAQAQGTGCPQDKFRRRTNAVPIIDPETGKSIFDNEPSSSNNTPSRSSESSARETPQPVSIYVVCVYGIMYHSIVTVANAVIY